MLRLPAQWWLRKPRQPKLVSSKRPKLPNPKPSGRSRSRGPLRLSHSKGNMATSCGTCQVTLYTSPPELKSTLVAFYHILLGQTPPSPPFILSQRAPSVEEQPASTTPPPPVPKQSPRSKRWHPSPDPVESMPLGGTTLKAALGDPQLQEARDSALGQSTQAKPH